ncbi:MAG: hypothetical protein RBS92_02870 [Candidatus Cloacimonadales bacterium]|jgi:hypothetical protein|nr:hypothetical protein [Candidatus Cloacimonadales bacterium]
MKKSFFIVILAVWISYSFADMIITRQEGNNFSQEIYAKGRFAEVINNRVVSVWDFRNMQLTLVNYDIKSYTQISFDNFKAEIARQTDAEIQIELDNLDDETKRLMIESTNTLFAGLIPRLDIIRDTVMIANYPSLEYKVLNDTLLIQRIWISKKAREDIAKEIPIESMKHVESIFKEKRSKHLGALGLHVDGITQLVEAVEQNGYIMKRFDYGIRTKSNPSIYKTIESIQNEITDISHMTVDEAIFLPPKNFKSLKYNDYQIRLIKYLESLE